MTTTGHQTMAELQAALDEIRRSPKDSGVLELIVRRPETGQREVLPSAELNFSDGLAGDCWKTRGSAEKPANPDMQLTVMNARAVAAVAGDKSCWPIAGDQLYVDMDLSVENLPAGTKVEIGSAIIQISRQPHTGCKKFLARFGQDALQFVNSEEGKRLRLRGLNARVLKEGVIKVGNVLRKNTQ